MVPNSDANFHTSVRDAITERYRHSRYLIDPNRYCFQKVKRILAIAFKFIRVLKERRKIPVEQRKPLPVGKFEVAHVFVPDEDIKSAETYFFKKATDEVKTFLKPSQYEKISKESNEILYYVGRVLPEDEVTIVGRATDVMRDLSSTTFCVPMTDKSSPIAYALVNDVHWNDNSVKHCGVETTLRYVLKHMYVIEGRSLVKRIRNTCQRCRYLEKRTLAVMMGPISKHSITIAPAFYICQVDIAGPYNSYSYHQKRTTVKIYLLVFCCCTTSATNIKVMENYASSAFMQAFIRFACEVGYPKRVLTDEGSQLIKGCNDMRLNFQDLKYRLHRDVKVEFDTCPVGGHNVHGKVERRIRHIRESLDKSVSNERLGIMQWETIAAVTANSINDLPLALGDVKSDLDNLDLITPNRLLLGRNNNRSPVGSMCVTNSHEKILETNNKIFEAWFENWLVSHVPKLMDQPKWFKTDRDLKPGDIVLFLKQEKELCDVYQYGIVETVHRGRDGIIRKADVRYRNASETTNRTTCRSVRSLIVIHPVDEVDVTQELGEIAIQVDIERKNTVAANMNQ